MLPKLNNLYNDQILRLPGSGQPFFVSIIVALTPGSIKQRHYGKLDRQAQEYEAGEEAGLFYSRRCFLPRYCHCQQAENIRHRTPEKAAKGKCAVCEQSPDILCRCDNVPAYFLCREMGKREQAGHTLLFTQSFYQ